MALKVGNKIRYFGPQSLVWKEAIVVTYNITPWGKRLYGLGWADEAKTLLSNWIHEGDIEIGTYEVEVIE